MLDRHRSWKQTRSRLVETYSLHEDCRRAAEPIVALPIELPRRDRHPTRERLDGEIPVEVSRHVGREVRVPIGRAALEAERLRELRLAARTSDVDHELACDAKRCGRAEVFFDQGQREVDAGRDPGRRVELTVVDEERIGIETELRESGGDVVDEAPVRRRAATVEEARRGETVDPGTDGDDAPYALGDRPDPRRDGAVDLRLSEPVTARNDERVERGNVLHRVRRLDHDSGLRDATSTGQSDGEHLVGGHLGRLGLRALEHRGGEGVRRADEIERGHSVERQDTDPAPRRLPLHAETMPRSRRVRQDVDPTISDMSPRACDGRPRASCVDRLPSSRRTNDIMPLELTVDGETREIAMSSRVTVNGADTAADLARAGLGLIQAPRYRFERDLAEGTLVEVLAPYRPPSTPLVALYPQSRQLSPRVRVFVDWVAHIFSTAKL